MASFEYKIWTSDRISVLRSAFSDTVSHSSHVRKDTSAILRKIKSTFVVEFKCLCREHCYYLYFKNCSEGMKEKKYYVSRLICGIVSLLVACLTIWTLRKQLGSDTIPQINRQM